MDIVDDVSAAIVGGRELERELVVSWLNHMADEAIGLQVPLAAFAAAVLRQAGEAIQNLEHHQ